MLAEEKETPFLTQPAASEVLQGTLKGSRRGTPPAMFFPKRPSQAFLALGGLFGSSFLANPHPKPQSRLAFQDLKGHAGDGKFKEYERYESKALASSPGVALIPSSSAQALASAMSHVRPEMLLTSKEIEIN